MFPWVNRVEHNPYSNNKYAHFDDNGLPLHGLSVNSPRIHVITM